MELKAAERISLGNLMPKEGNFTNLLTIRETREASKLRL
jgi:hypothetical protein